MDTWTKDHPSKPGWYWHKEADSIGEPGDFHVRLLLVYEWQNGLYVTIFSEDKPSGEYQPHPVSHIGGLWQWCKPLSDGLKEG